MIPDLATLEREISTAIGQQETGSGAAGVGASLHNPGALKFSPWQSQYGARAGPAGFSSFPSLAAGWDALTARVDQIIAGGGSIASIVDTWAPPSDGNTNNPARVAQIAASTGLNPLLPIAAQSSNSESGGSGPVVSASTPGPGATMAANFAAWLAWLGSATSLGSFPVGTVAGGGTVADQGTMHGLWGRAASFIVGIALIAIGALMLRQTQTIIRDAAPAAMAAIAAA